MDYMRQFGFDPHLVDFLVDHLDFTDETDTKSSHHAPSRAYVRDSKAMANTHADIIDSPDAYKFMVDMPGLKSEQIKVSMEDNTLVVSGERRQRDKDKDHKEGVKYIRMERRQGKFLKKFQLPENADSDQVCASYHLSGWGFDCHCAEEAAAGAQQQAQPQAQEDNGKQG